MKIMMKIASLIAGIAVCSTSLAKETKTDVPGTSWQHYVNPPDEFDGIIRSGIQTWGTDNYLLMIECDNNKVNVIGIGSPFAFWFSPTIETRLDNRPVYWDWISKGQAAAVIAYVYEKVGNMKSSSELKIRIRDGYDTEIVTFDLTGMNYAIDMLAENCSELKQSQ